MWTYLLDEAGPFGLNRDFAVNLASEAIGVVISAVLIAVFLQLMQGLARWMSVRKPRKRILARSCSDILTSIEKISELKSLSEPKDVVAELGFLLTYARHAARRIVTAQRLFSDNDLTAIAELDTACSAIEGSLRHYQEIFRPTATDISAWEARVTGTSGVEYNISMQDYCVAPAYVLHKLASRYGVRKLKAAAALMSPQWRAYRED